MATTTRPLPSSRLSSVFTNTERLTKAKLTTAMLPALT
jgi:hypothetical protein